MYSSAGMLTTASPERCAASPTAGAPRSERYLHPLDAHGRLPLALGLFALGGLVHACPFSSCFIASAQLSGIPLVMATMSRALDSFSSLTCRFLFLHQLFLAFLRQNSTVLPDGNLRLLLSCFMPYPNHAAAVHRCLHPLINGADVASLMLGVVQSAMGYTLEWHVFLGVKAQKVTPISTTVRTSRSLNPFQ